jgi:hypothetical protein
METITDDKTAILIIVNMVLTTLVPVLVIFLKRVRKCRSMCCDIENGSTRSGSLDSSPMAVANSHVVAPTVVVDEVVDLNESVQVSQRSMSPGPIQVPRSPAHTHQIVDSRNLVPGVP